MPRKANAIPYSVHPAVAYARAVIDNLPKTTGKTLAEWVRLVQKSGLKSEKERRKWLKEEHQIGATTAAMIAECAAGKSATLTDPPTYLKMAQEYVEAMYAGPKAALRPLHDALLRLGTSLGPDVKVCPCTTIVPLYRRHVFAEIKPSTRTRIDLGLALKGAPKPPPARLRETGGLQKGNRISHRIPLADLADIDAEVKDWLRIAYALDGSH